MSVIEFYISDPVVRPWGDDEITPKSSQKEKEYILIMRLQWKEGRTVRIISDDNAVLSGDENIVASPDSFS